MRPRLFISAGVLTIALLSTGAASAVAVSPVDLGSSHVVDQAGVLGGNTSKIDKAISTLSSQKDIDLFVVYVDRFTSPTSAESWANTTATNNNLGPRDYLLAVATDGRAYYLSGDSSGPVSDSQLATIEAKDIEPSLKAGDWSGAAVGAATGLSSAVGGGGSGVGWLIAAIVLLLVIVLVVFLVLRSRRKATARGADADPDHELRAMPLLDLQRQAGSALVQTDDAIRASEEELGFAVASYGAESTGQFQAALEEAKSALTDAFTLKQKLDDSEPDTEQETRDWNIGIVKLCGHANAVLDEQAKAFDELRSLEKDIPGAAAKVEKDAATVESRLDAGDATLGILAQRYTDATLSTVADNADQARERLAFATTAIASSQQTATAGDLGAAAIGIRAAEESVAQAALLLDAIDRLATDLEQAQAGIDSTVAELTRDVAEARALAAAGDPQGAITAAADTAERALADVRGRIAAGKVNPLELVGTLEAANQNIDGVLQSVRDAQAQQQRAAAALDRTLASAQSRVSAGTDFITARRGAVGTDARTRLAEAGRLVVLAQSAAATDPVGALANAQRADELAAQAIQLAEQDVGGFGGGGGLGGGMGGLGGVLGGGGGSGGNGSLGAVLGGILIGSVLGGNGGGGGGNAGGGGGGFSSPGGFGGSGSRARRGGGRF